MSAPIELSKPYLFWSMISHCMFAFFVLVSSYIVCLLSPLPSNVFYEPI